MLDVSVSGAAYATAPTADFIKGEILRVGASAADFERALGFVRCKTGWDPRAYEALPPRVRRLVDLLAVAGDGLSSIPIETTNDPDPAVA